MINTIKLILKLLFDDIDSGNSNLSEEEQLEVLNLLLKINTKWLSKIESAKYIGVSRATFDNYVKKGLLPKGNKRQGYGLSWNKADLNNFLKIYGNRN